MQEGIVNIKLVKKSVVVGYKSKYSSDGSHFGNRAKCVQVINSLLLGIPFSYNPILTTLHLSISQVFDTKYMLTINICFTNR